MDTHRCTRGQHHAALGQCAYCAGGLARNRTALAPGEPGKPKTTEALGLLGE